MTTAARPTFEPAKGGTGRGENDLSALSKQFSSRDLPGHTKLKYRQPGQDTKDEVMSRDLKRDLEEKEKSGKRHKTTESRRTRHLEITSSVDQDDPVDSSSDESSSDDDDTGELLAELARIKRERANERQKKEQEKAAEAERIRKETILSGNPLLNSDSAADFSVKRRWDDDVVFKNCAKGVDEDKKDRFINDTIRSEFHKKFMNKYIK